MKLPSWEWPDARGWIGAGSFFLTVMCLVLIWLDHTLLDNQAFLVLATAIIVTGWVNGPVSWAYGQNKSSGELSAQNADLISRQVDGPTKTVVVNDESTPVPVKPDK